MPVKSQPRERPIIEVFLSAYENDAWKDASLDWVEERQDGAVEVIATKGDGTKLALEHTLIQPFVGEKFDSEAFVSAYLDVVIPVHAIPKGYKWDEVGRDLLAWLVVNHVAAPKDGQSEFEVPVGSNSNSGPLVLKITLRSMSLPGMAGNCLIARHKVPEDLETVVEKALRTKIPKLVKTAADKRILLLERDQIALADGQIYQEVGKLAPKFPDLLKVDELWFADTSSHGCADFALIDGRGLVELLSFERGVLKTRRDDRSSLGPPRREF